MPYISFLKSTRLGDISKAREESLWQFGINNKNTVLNKVPIGSLFVLETHGNYYPIGFIASPIRHDEEMEHQGEIQWPSAPDMGLVTPYHSEVDIHLLEMDLTPLSLEDLNDMGLELERQPTANQRGGGWKEISDDVLGKILAFLKAKK